MTHKGLGIHRACDKRQISSVQTSLRLMLDRVNPLLRGGGKLFAGGGFSFVFGIVLVTSFNFLFSLFA